MVSIIIKEWTTKIELVPAVQKRNAAVLLRKPGRLAPQYAIGGGFDFIDTKFIGNRAYNQFIKGNFDYGVKEDTKARSHKNSNVIIDASDGDTEELKDK